MAATGTIITWTLCVAVLLLWPALAPLLLAGAVAIAFTALLLLHIAVYSVRSVRALGAAAHQHEIQAGHDVTRRQFFGAAARVTAAGLATVFLARAGTAEAQNCECPGGKPPAAPTSDCSDGDLTTEFVEHRCRGNNCADYFCQRAYIFKCKQGKWLFSGEDPRQWRKCEKR